MSILAMSISELVMDKFCIFSIHGLALISSFYSTQFLFTSLLHVLEITKNLIATNQFTKDNNVYIEFHPHFFCVKDCLTHRLLLQGSSKSGMYH
jgi:hypothetical protein